MNNIITYEQRYITPDDAKEMLNRMGRNRNINIVRLNNLKNAIQNGRFTSCPNPICFDEEGTLIDGQHRLQAIVETGIPVRLSIAYNVPHDAVIDNGLERKAGDSLYMRGIISKELSNDRCISIARRFLSIKKSKNKPSNDEIGEFLNKYQEPLLKAVSLISYHNGICNSAPCRTAAFAALLNGVREEQISDFFSIVNSGYGNGDEDSAAITFRNQVLDYKMNGGQIASRTESFAEQALKDFSEGKVRRRRYTKEEHPYMDKIEI